jgi:hypothetical protein
VPIADLNGKTLDEVFNDNNLFTATSLTNGVFDNGIYTFLTTSSTTSRINMIYNFDNNNTIYMNATVNIISTDNFLYQFFIFNSPTQSSSFTLSLGNQTISSLITLNSNKDRLLIGHANQLKINNYTIKNIHVINLTALGITATKEVLDFWYSVWQQNHKLGMRVHRASGNDIPLAVLNNQSLNQVFVGGQLVTNGDFSNGTTNWTGLGSEILSVNDGIMTVTSTVAGSQVRLRQSTPIVSIGEIFYFNSFVKVNQTHSFSLARPFSFSLNPILNQFTFISTLGTSTSTEKLRFGYGTSNIGDSFDVKYVNLYNLTSLGIATLTKSQLDYLFTVWQFNQVNALVARQFIQEA